MTTIEKINLIISKLDEAKEAVANDEDYAVDDIIYDICKILEDMDDKEYNDLIKELNKDIKYYQDIDTLGQWYEIIQEERR